jgi:NAD(P)-dependent dehydrogenase (short-subunit alcohol dehydrogenase family)
MTRTLAIELGPFGITVNCLAPGSVATRMTERTAARLGLSFEELQELAAEQTPSAVSACRRTSPAPSPSWRARTPPT